MSDPTDEILMTEFQLGKVESLTVLYSRYKEVLYNYFLRTTRDKEVAADILMTVFERIIKYKKSFRLENKFKSWLYQIANNALRDHFRNEGGLRLENRAAKEISETDSFLDRKERKEVLQLALSKLNASERRLVNMYYLLEMPYAQIAEQEEITINNARIKICRALKKLKELLKDSGI